MLPPKTNMYSDEPDAPPAGGEAKSEESSGKEALLPKSIFGEGVKPGDKITLTAVSVQENEVVCEKAEDEPSEDGENRESDMDGEQPEEAPESGGMSSMLSD